MAEVAGLPAARVVSDAPPGRPVWVEFPDGRAKVNRPAADLSRILPGESVPGAAGMPNDAKLGLLAGVGGVVLAAVLYFQTPAPGPSPAGPPAAAALPAAPSAPLARATPSPEKPPAAAVVAGRRTEVEAVPTSRPATPDEDD